MRKQPFGSDVLLRDGRGDGILGLMLSNHPIAEKGTLSIMVSAQSPLVLIVDDDPLLRKMVSKMVTRMGYRAEVASDGYEALDKLATLSPDVVTLDVMMPDITGIDVLHRMASDASIASIPVVLLTAMQENVLWQQGLPSQMRIRYLEKPFQYDRLRQLIDEFTLTPAALPV